MKGGDKKWLLIDGRFICFNPDDQTMQSNLVQKGAKVLMGSQSALFSFVQFISSQFCYLASEPIHHTPENKQFIARRYSNIYKRNELFH